MSSDNASDADPAMKPQVIDLDAVEVTPDETLSEASAGQPPRSPPPPAPKRRSNRGIWAGVALVAALGAVAGGWLYRDILSAYLPSSAMNQMAARVGAVEITSKNLAAQAQAAADTAGSAATSVAAAGAAVKDANAAAASAAAAAAALEPRIAAIEKNLQTSKADLDKLRATLSSAPASGASGADPAALAAIAQRLDALEKDVAALKAGGASNGDAAMVTALRQSLADLQAKIAAGAPYRADLDNVLRLVPAAGSNDLLLSYADNGLPNAKGLAAELRAAVPALPKPEAPAPSTGYASSLWDAVTSIVSVRDVGGSDWQALAETTAKLADEQQLPEAIAGLDAAQGKLPDGLARWRERATQRVKLETAAAELARSVALTIAARGGGQ